MKPEFHANLPFFIPHLGCPHHCSFCNQNTISSTAAAPTPQEVADVCAYAWHTVKNRRKTEIAFFGGSFTAIPKAQMCAYLKAVQPFLGADGFSGIRISTRPDYVSHEILKLLLDSGVTAIELGAQSLSDDVLQKNCRGHDAESVRNAIRRIQSYGISSGLQMMTGLYGSTPELDWKTAEEICRLQPHTVRVYPVVVLKDTPLAALVQQGRYLPPNAEEAAAFCANLLDLFDTAGIRVIRCGLQASPDLEQANIAGAYHPAFRELCDTFRMRKRMEAVLTGRQGTVTLRVHPSCISRTVGLNKRNLHFFQQQGLSIRLLPDSGVPPFFVLEAECSDETIFEKKTHRERRTCFQEAW